MRAGQLFSGHTSNITSLDFSPDGLTLASTSNDHSVIIWDLSANPVAYRVGPELGGSSSNPIWQTGDSPHFDWSTSAFAPDGTTLAVAGNDGKTSLWDVTDRENPRYFDLTLDAPGPTFAIVFSPRGSVFAAAGKDGTLTMWDASHRGKKPGKLGVSLPLGVGTVYSLSFAPDGSKIVAAGEDGTVALWDVSDPTRPHKIGPVVKAHAGPVYSTAFSPDGEIVATAGSDGRVVLWHVARRVGIGGGKISEVAHSGSVYSLAFSPDGTILATASFDSSTLLWDVTNPGKPRRVGQPLKGHTGPVFSVAFAPNSETLATSGDDGRVILWDITQRERPRRIGFSLLFPGRVFGVSFSSDKKTLAAGFPAAMWDYTMIDILHEVSVERACDRAGGGLTTEEWAAYVPNLPYRDTC